MKHSLYILIIRCMCYLQTLLTITETLYYTSSCGIKGSSTKQMENNKPLDSDSNTKQECFVISM